MFRKRGISPLIATVLILGFTVAIAAVIMTWGTGFTKTMQKSVEETAQKQIICSSDVTINVKSAKLIGNKVKLLIENRGSKDIDKFNIRVHGSEGVDSVETVSGLGAYGIQSFEVFFDPAKIGTTVTEVEVFPSITLQNESFFCSNTYDKEEIFSTFIIGASLILKDGLGVNIARFDSFGNLILKGILEESSNHLRTTNDEWVIRNNGEDVFILDQTSGNLYIDGNLFENQGVLTPTGKDFIIKDDSGSIIAYVGETGSLFLKETLAENGNP